MEKWASSLRESAYKRFQPLKGALLPNEEILHVAEVKEGFLALTNRRVVDLTDIQKDFSYQTRNAFHLDRVHSIHHDKRNWVLEGRLTKPDGVFDSKMKKGEIKYGTFKEHYLPPKIDRKEKSEKSMIIEKHNEGMQIIWDLLSDIQQQIAASAYNPSIDTSYVEDFRSPGYFEEILATKTGLYPLWKKISKNKEQISALLGPTPLWISKYIGNRELGIGTHGIVYESLGEGLAFLYLPYQLIMAVHGWGSGVGISYARMDNSGKPRIDKKTGLQMVENQSFATWPIRCDISKLDELEEPMWACQNGNYPWIIYDALTLESGKRFPASCLDPKESFKKRPVEEFAPRWTY